ncbi:hypothetical protein DSO57_1022756 [Entomophthora muscae]|uniref:Uncharacterized protein n=1 Tax=Entomophthora muscae TaxID=34485 RepID=A0ACC2TQ55_9FUNG|nr:hypothetical protein DSO57_1022756 [Entomophthora muscae]
MYDLVLARVPVNCLEVLLFVQGLCDAHKDVIFQSKPSTTSNLVKPMTGPWMVERRFSSAMEKGAVSHVTVMWYSSAKTTFLIHKGLVAILNLSKNITSDKLLLIMLTRKPQLRDSNPETMWAASPQDQLPGHLQIFGLEPEQDLNLGNPLRLDESKSPTSTLPTLKVPVNSTNQQAGLAIDPKIT